jgi:lipopolysaccharide/colanic/teichoic acid biosynthesis glycosyltransferase
MVRDADPSVHVAHVNAFVHGRLEGSDASGAAFKLQNDRRVTRVGALLRRTSIDELPQLINVLLGEMSLVGPRPVPPYEVSHYDQTHLGRFGASPGITGLWQVSGRCSVSFDEMVRLDLEYITKQSLAIDLKILFLTIPAIVSGRGAG